RRSTQASVPRHLLAPPDAHPARKGHGESQRRRMECARGARQRLAGTSMTVMTRTVRFAADHYLVVPLGSILALAWANTRADSYFTFAHSWSLAVNDIGMTLFFALVTQEIVEATMPGGALGTWRRAMLPIIAALGGLLGSVLLYL